MPSYKYKAMNESGKVIHGRLDAINDSDLEARLLNLQLDLIQYRIQKQQSAGFFQRGISREDLINFCFYLEQQHSAGISILESLADIRDNVDNPQFRNVLSAVIKNIEGGNTLSEAMAEFSTIFSPIFVSLITAGEQSSQLSEVLKDLIASLKWQDELAAQAKKIMIYPAFIGVFVLAVAVFMLTYLTPQIIGFLATTGNAIPWYTQALINTSDTLIAYWYAFLFTPIVSFVVLRIAIKKSSTVRLTLDRFKLHLPIIGPIFHKIIISRFTNYFALMYSAGISIMQCLNSSETIVGNTYVAASIHQIGIQIERGSSLTDSFSGSGIFPNLVVRMIRVGESTGALDKSLRNVSYFYNRDVQNAIGRVEVMIEPALILLLALFLGWIAVSVLFPIYDMMGSV